MSTPARPQTDTIEPISTPAPSANVIERPYAEDEAPEIKNRGGNNPVTSTAEGISGKILDKASQAKDELTPDNSHIIKETREVKVTKP
ncbi:g768 [Coccomyxa elongata]